MLVLLPELWVAFVQPTFILIYFFKKKTRRFLCEAWSLLRGNVPLGHPHQSKQSNGSVVHSILQREPPFGGREQHDVSTQAFLQPGLKPVPSSVDHGPGLLIGFGNQLQALFGWVGAVDAWSAALRPRFDDGLARWFRRAFILISI